MSPKPAGMGSPQFKITFAGVAAQTGSGVGATVTVAVKTESVPQEGVSDQV